MPSTTVLESILDTILGIQITVAWAGEESEPKRLGWWRTDLVDEQGGGDLFRRLFPRTHQWASLEAVRKAAIQQDQQIRSTLADTDDVYTLFFWGFAIDEKLADRLAFHKRQETPVLQVLPLLLDLTKEFSKSEFETAVQIPNQKAEFQVVPGGRELQGEILNALDDRARKLAAALLPIADRYPMPFYRLGR